MGTSDHFLHKVVDKVLTIAPISPSLERMPLVRESSSGASQFEWPDEIVGLLEMGTN